ncbi:MAG: hypothetical protein K1Y36_14185 [Blastocatellia bacterium]|nr:hypothetical protein [Blastocatellia bacterium]
MLPIATHGYFLAETNETSPSDGAAQRLLTREQDAPTDADTIRKAPPLLQSWLFFCRGQ